MNCPCGRPLPFERCCGPAIAGTAPAANAEALMRSRYTAYVLRESAYLLATWHPGTRPASLDLAAEPQPNWIGLEVRRHEQQDAEHASVEFVARHRLGGRAHRLHEVSRFVRVDGRWYYVDGDRREPG